MRQSWRPTRAVIHSDTALSLVRRGSRGNCVYAHSGSFRGEEVFRQALEASLKLETQKSPWLDSLLRSLLGLVGQLSEEGIHGSCR